MLFFKASVFMIVNVPFWQVLYQLRYYILATRINYHGYSQHSGEFDACYDVLSVCGTATYRLSRHLVAPYKPTHRTFDELVKLVKDHHQPPSSSTVQRFNFNLQHLCPEGRDNCVRVCGWSPLIIRTLQIWGNIRWHACLRNPRSTSSTGSTRFDIQEYALEIAQTL